MKIVATDKAPAAVGPYSQAVVTNGLVFCAGQIGIDPKTGDLAAGFENQTIRILENLKAVVEAAGSSVEKIVKTNVFIKNMSDYGKFNEIYGKFMGDTKPARATVQVAGLPKDALIEIEAIAEL